MSNEEERQRCDHQRNEDEVEDNNDDGGESCFIICICQFLLCWDSEEKHAFWCCEHCNHKTYQLLGHYIEPCST